MKNNLTRAQAQIAFINGKKIRHKYFTDDEFIFLNSKNEMEDADGNIFNKMDFWISRGTEQFNEGWEILQEIDDEIDMLRKRQADNTRWFSQEEYERLNYLLKKKYK